MGPGGKELLERVQAEGAEAGRKVANMVFPQCAKLIDLWIGDYARAEAVRDGNGRFMNLMWHKNETRDDLT